MKLEGRGPIACVEVSEGWDSEYERSSHSIRLEDLTARAASDPKSRMAPMGTITLSVDIFPGPDRESK
jgi:hypothetical protein